MIRRAIVICLANYCTFLFSQELVFTRKFNSPPQNIPLEIINNHSDFFYVLRLNNAIHDMVIERRVKASGSIRSFTPLKLDSVNKPWFDYENLDYIFFEQNNKVYFVFQKILNTKRTLYLKVIDTAGKSSGFIELANLEIGKNEFFNIEFKRTARNKILIVSERTSVIGTTRKTIQLYDIEKRRILWTKIPDPENSLTDRSSSFECNEHNDLFYFKTRSEILNLKELTFDTLFIVKWESGASAPVKTNVELGKLIEIKTLFVLPMDSTVFISIQGLEENQSSQNPEGMILNALFSKNLETVYSVVTPYNKQISKQLTFFDGPDSSCVNKTHTLLNNYVTGEYIFTLSQRTEDFYYKEFMLRKTNLATGEVLLQKIIPRKILFFKNRLKYKQIMQPMICVLKNELKLFIMEAGSNLNIPPDDFDYHQFNKVGDLANSNIVQYSTASNNHLDKKLIFKNSDFDLVPLKYNTHLQEMIFYFNNGVGEKFAILKLNPF